MYQGQRVIDTHGHISTPPHFRAYAYNLRVLRTPDEGELAIPEPAMRAALDRHLRLLDACRVDVQLLSPRPVGMMHWERPFIVDKWTRVTNDLIAKQCAMHPDRFIGVAQLPQTPDLNIAKCVDELDRVVSELGFVGALLNPDPAGDRKAPGLDREEWFPLYAKAEALNATLVVHPSLSFDPRLEPLPHSYQYNNTTEEALATMLLERSTVFKQFPKLRIVVCHCGGCPRRILELGDVIDATNPSRGPDNVVRASGESAGGQVGFVADDGGMERPDVSNNLFFDTCAHDPWFLSAALRQWGVRRMVFGTETPGAGSALINPMSGRPADDILATLECLDFLSNEDRVSLVHNNPLKVFPLMVGKAGL